MREYVIGTDKIRNRIQILELEESDLSLKIEQSEIGLKLLINDRDVVRGRIRELKSLLQPGPSKEVNGYGT